jgi:hypothetical protein
MALLLLAQSRVVINEVMANPRGPDSRARSPEDRNEFIELVNLSGDTIDLQGWRLTDGDDLDTLCAWTDTLIRARYPHVRIQTTLLLPHGFALALDPEYTDPAPESGFVQPYRLPDRVLLLRPGNTTLGNGLAVTDAVSLWSMESTEVSCFGTPGDAGDSVPRDPGDGVSLERVAPAAVDSDTTWHQCRDSSGCTPGRPNSICGLANLSCRRLLCFPLTLRSGISETLAVTVANTGRVPARNWWVVVSKQGQALAVLDGPELAAGAEIELLGAWREPAPGTQTLAAEIRWIEDRDSSDDRLHLTVNLSPDEQWFSLSSEVFGPGLRSAPESLVVSYSLLGAGGQLTVRAYDLNGRERAIVFQGAAVARVGQFAWDGTGRDGRLLPTGLYILGLEYRSGKEKVFEKKAVVLAKGR